MQHRWSQFWCVSIAIFCRSLTRLVYGFRHFGGHGKSQRFLIGTSHNLSINSGFAMFDDSGGSSLFSNQRRLGKGPFLQGFSPSASHPHPGKSLGKIQHFYIYICFSPWPSWFSCQSHSFFLGGMDGSYNLAIILPFFKGMSIQN